MYQTLYRCPNVRTEQIAVYTNTGPAVAFRAPGYVEGAFALESAMDELARELAIDPVELRRRNYAERDQQRTSRTPSPEGLRLCYDGATEAFGWATYRGRRRTGPKRRGVGFAAHDWVGGGGKPPGYAWVKLNADGTADVVTGTQDIGTGTRTGLTPGRRRGAGLPLERVALHLGDTATGPYAPVSSGSATQATIGPAIRAAAADAKAKLLEAAAAVLEAPAGDLSVRDGQGPRRRASRGAGRRRRRGHAGDRAAHDPAARARAAPIPRTRRSAPSAPSASRSRSISRPAR